MWEEITVALAGLGPVALELERNSSVEVRGPGVALCRLGGRAGRPGWAAGALGGALGGAGGPGGAHWVGRAGLGGASWAGRGELGGQVRRGG